jgi:hypothetical protein
MKDIKIESGINIPEPQKRDLKYPIASLNIGDSFQFPIEKYASVNALVRRFQKLSGQSFTLRKSECRCWRTA